MHCRTASWHEQKMQVRVDNRTEHKAENSIEQQVKASKSKWLHYCYHTIPDYLRIICSLGGKPRVRRAPERFESSFLRYRNRGSDFNRSNVTKVTVVWVMTRGKINSSLFNLGNETQFTAFMSFRGWKESVTLILKLVLLRRGERKSERWNLLCHS